MSEDTSSSSAVSRTSNTLEYDPLGLASALNLSGDQRRAATEIWELWKGNPRKCVAAYRTIIAHQQMLANTVDTRSHIEEQFRTIASQMNLVMQADQLGAGAWSLLIQDGLHSLYLDALLLNVVWESESEETKVLRSDLLGGLAHCIPHTEKYPDAADDILRRAPSLLKIIWQHRDQLDLRTLDIHGFERVWKAMPEQDIVEVLHAFYALYLKRHADQPGPETYLPQLGIYFWTRINWRGELVIHLVKLLRFLTKVTPHPLAERETFARDILVKVVGADKFIERADKDMQIEDYPDDLTRTIVWLLVNLNETRCLQIYFDANSPLPYAIAASTRSVANPRTTPVLRAAVFTGTLMMFIHDTDKTRRYRGHNAFELLTCAIDLSLVPDDVSGLNDGDHKSIIGVVNNLAGFIMTLRRRPTLDAPRYLEELEDAARLFWWPNLNRLRIAQLRSGANEQQKELIQWWIRLGKSLRLSEEQERTRLQSKAERHCSWQECEFSMTKKESRAGLKKCAGCSQAQYCDRECQMNDWSKGGHKKICKRLRK
ncbi:unnamed protein product [Peniophora sp. CBMAI 1063]|nr:unnamed protein product [Peniophora sp. CBMAI 1063]